MVHNTLHSWDKTELRGPRHRLKQLQKELNAVLAGPLSEEALVNQRVIQDQIEDILEQEELYWVQRGRANWLRHGDQNTSFFHGFASQRKRKNFIRKLQRDNGVWEEDQDQLRTMASDYFAQLFTSGVYEADPYVIDKVKLRVDSTMNAALMAPYTREEVKKGLFNIGDLKAPGPDGLHAVFYKRFWHIIGEDLTDEVLAAISSKSIPEGWNDTTIVLIPKVENPETITQFRPISLCNVVYKVISKVVANRLKGLLPDIISPFQSAFVPGRLITDNFLVAYESYHTIKNKRIGKFGSCAVKLDMHKAYDRVEWCFLESIMIKLGFNPDWVKLIMACVSSVRYKGGMGFRDLHCFNLAMLSKQCWRLISEPESLCARVLRAKYFPDGDILNCDLKKGSSYTWQSLWSGIQTFKKGHIWRVGDGSNISIWDDPWIPSSPTRRVATRRGNIVLTKVSDLIDHNTRQWDEELIRDIFWQIDAERILQIPLAVGMMDDFVSWHYNRNGLFSVKSAYHLEWNHQHGRKLARTNIMGSGGTGAIIRDNHGMFISGCNRTLPYIADAPTAEAMALRDGLLLAGQFLLVIVRGKLIVLLIV
ncbi:uncharacterized protein [Lolium perenne]|uniref:uncharacterized protein n=1 Tax=Lolium perenne TaxID=4522 RepID=UPI003A99C248